MSQPQKDPWLVLSRLIRLERFSRSPLDQIYARPITEDGLVDAIDTCRIFEDSFNFWDEDGDGWYLVSPFNPTRSGALDRFHSSIIQSSSSDIKANYNVRGLEKLFGYSVFVESNAVDLLLSLGAPGVLSDLEKMLGRPPLFEYIITRRWNFVNTLLGWGVDPYCVHLSDHSSPVPESPLSLAMYSSWTFWGFRNALRKMYPNVEDIARQELKEGRPLLDAGWQMETLSALLELDFEIGYEPKRPSRIRGFCDCCRHRIWCVHVQPFWQVTLESIKNGTYQQRFLSDTQDEQSSLILSYLPISDSNGNSQRDTIEDSETSHNRTSAANEAAQPEGESFSSENDTSGIKLGKNEAWCMQCWLYYKKTGHRRSCDMRETQTRATWKTQTLNRGDSLEDDFSPFLFNA